MLSKVAIVKDSNHVSAVNKVLDLINAKEIISSVKKVLIKPNYLTAKLPDSGVTTNTHIVSTVIDFVKRYGTTDIIVADGGWSDTDRTFDTVGIREIAEKKKIQLVDLNDDKRVKVKIPHASVLKEVNIAKTVLDCDAIINIPKLKIHSFAKVTLCIKNLMGVTLPKNSMHTQLDYKLADLATYLKPLFNIIDGTVGCERNEHSGDPVPMDLIIGGKDIVAMDTVGSLVMGVDPYEVDYIRYTAQKKVGTMNLNEIDILGESIENVKKIFKQ